MVLPLTIILIAIGISIVLLYYHTIFHRTTTKEGLNFGHSDLQTELAKLGVTVNTKTKTLHYKNQILSYKGHANTDSARKIANDKASMYTVLRKHNILVPKSYKWNKQLDNNTNIQRLHTAIPKSPYVIKPTNGIQGQDVYIGVITEREIISKIEHILANKRYKGAVIEEMLAGKTYRVLMIDGQVVDIVQIILPTVTGNGRNNLRTLVNNYNTYQRKHGLNEFKIINLDIDYVRQQGIAKGLDSFIPLGKQVILSRIANNRNGCRIVRINPHTISALNINVFKKVHRLSGLRISGTDYISHDITQDLVYVLDVNPGPGMGTHCHGFSSDENNAFISRLSKHIYNMF